MRRPCATVRMDLKSQGSSRSPQGLGVGLELGLALRLGPQGHLKQTKGGGFAAVPISGWPVAGGWPPSGLSGEVLCRHARTQFVAEYCLLPVWIAGFDV